MFATIRRYESIDQARTDDTSAHADESTRLVSAWVREQKLETALPNPPKITTGEVVAHTTSELVKA